LCSECHWNAKKISLRKCRLQLGHTAPNWQDSFAQPPGVTYYDYELQRHVKPLIVLGNQTMADTYERRLDRLTDIQERQEQEQQRAVESSATSSVFSYFNSSVPTPVYVCSALDVRTAKTSSQAQHYRQLLQLLEQMVAGHDWIGAADVLKVLCQQYRELPYSAYVASVGVYTHALRVSTAESTLSTVHNNLVRFLRACTSRSSIPYRHIALRDLSTYFIERGSSRDARDLWKAHISTHPYSLWPDAHGQLGVAMTNVIFDLHTSTSTSTTSGSQSKKKKGRRGGGSKSDQRQRDYMIKQAINHLEISLTLQPSKYKELACYVDLLLLGQKVKKAQHALEDFCRVNPNMLAAHAAHFQFLLKYVDTDSIARCTSAARILALNPGDKGAVRELESHHEDGRIQASCFLPLLANHVEWAEEQYARNEDQDNYAEQVWTLLNEVCVIAFGEAINNNDRGIDDAVVEEEEQEEEQEEEEEEEEVASVAVLTLKSMLRLKQTTDNETPCWYHSGLPSAAVIANLPLSWNVVYRMHEGMSKHRPDKATAIHRITSYVECMVTDSTTGTTYDIAEITGKECYQEARQVLTTIGQETIPLIKRKWWLKRYKGKLPQSVAQMLKTSVQIVPEHE